MHPRKCLCVCVGMCVWVCEGMWCGYLWTTWWKKSLRLMPWNGFVPCTICHRISDRPARHTSHKDTSSAPYPEHGRPSHPLPFDCPLGLCVCGRGPYCRRRPWRCSVGPAPPREPLQGTHRHRDGHGVSRILSGEFMHGARQIYTSTRLHVYKSCEAQVYICVMEWRA